MREKERENVELRKPGGGGYCMGNSRVVNREKVGGMDGEVK